jgi:hypothetical protein
MINKNKNLSMKTHEKSREKTNFERKRYTKTDG